jgi:hypothetical protein
VKVEVLLATDTGADEADIVAEELGSAGVALTVRRAVPTRGPSELQWIVLLALPLQAILGEIGKDLYRSIKRLAGRLLVRQRAAGAARPVVVHDADWDLTFVVEPDLPLAALESLAGRDRGSLPPGPLRYDRELGEWRSVQDEPGAG